MIQWPIIHIVRRFGSVGGMESYVWHLVHGLARQGLLVVVVCEEVVQLPEYDIPIVTVDLSKERSRWKSMLSFRRRVDEKIKTLFGGRKVLIHSHERSLSHHVTTFHGPPIDTPGVPKCLSFFQRRLFAWVAMENDELLGPDVQTVLVVSNKVKQELIMRYPRVLVKNIDVAWPGVIPNTDSGIILRPIRKKTAGIKFLFVGREWRRKGLDIAVSIVSEFRKHNLGASLTIFGVDTEELPKRLSKNSWVVVMGWKSAINWSDFDILLHPARKEPFGMVVSEARNHGLPALISTVVGAGDLNFREVEAVPLEAPLSCWCNAVSRLLERREGVAETLWSWDDLVKHHISKIYASVSPPMVIL